MKRKDLSESAACYACASFVLLAVMGVILRSMPLLAFSWPNYKFLMHAHSHFAFAAWCFLSLAILLAKAVPGLLKATTLKRISIWTMISAAGMLFSFIYGGYNAISITFSTLFTIVTWAFAIICWHSLKKIKHVHSSALELIKASLVFLCLSSLGPIAVGPIGALMSKTSPIYMDAIYFYLHFQMNGWMTSAAAGILLIQYGRPENQSSYQRLSVRLFVWSNIPLFAAFCLWSKPGIILNVVALIASIMQFAGWLGIEKQFRKNISTKNSLMNLAWLALSFKILTQMGICIPDLGNWVFASRNIIIGYIHMIMLGVVSPTIFQSMSYWGWIKSRKVITLNLAFALLSGLYVGLLFVQSLLARWTFSIPFFKELLLVISVLLAAVGLGYFACCLLKNRFLVAMGH